MNDKCAGGTGAVIDKINAKLKIPASELSNQAYHGIKLHKVGGTRFESGAREFDPSGADPHAVDRWKGSLRLCRSAWEDCGARGSIQPGCVFGKR
jgi:hypothetical protein